MKFSFSLRHAAIFLIIGAIIIAIINITVASRLTSQLLQYDTKAELTGIALTVAKEFQYETLQIQKSLTNVSATGDRDTFKDAEKHFQNAQKNLDELTQLNPASKATYDDVRRKLQIYYDTGKQMAEVYINSGREAGNVLMKQPDTGFDSRANNLFEALQKIINPLEEKNTELKQLANEAATKLKLIIILINVLSTIGLIVVLFVFGRILFKRLGAEPTAISTIANNIAGGNFNNTINLKQGDTSSVLAAISSMQTNLGNNMEVADKKALEMLRIKTALDAASINIRIADKDGKIIYLNNALIKTLKQTEAEMRKKVADFDAENLIGRSIGIFYDDPDAAVERLKSLYVERQAGIVIGGRDYWLITNPIIDNNGQQDGTVGQWIDKTDELRVEQEVSQLVQAAAIGDLSHRIALEGKSGFFLNLAQSVNTMVSTTDEVIRETVSALERVANGDMTQQIETEYAGAYGLIRDNTNLTIQRLTDIVSEIKSIAHMTNVSATEIAAGNTDLSQRTEEQASSLEETASSMEQMASTVKQNADNARQANMMASEASQVAIKGGKVVNEVVTTMSEINASSKKIVDIISVIDGIAFQTNILALNAAVEAARAGEQGRGFAVVATEVRNLAQRSAAAAKEIKQLIGDSVDKVAGGTKLVEDAGKTMDEIVTAVKLVTDIVNEIAAASQEQSAGIDQVNNAITNMDEVTQQNAALVEQAAAAAASMEQQTQDLIDSVAVFKLLEQDSLQNNPQDSLQNNPQNSLPASPYRKLNNQAKAITAPKFGAKQARSASSKQPPKEEDWEEF